MAFRLACVLLLAAPVALNALDQSTVANANANPIRKVVTMLQNMEKKVSAEGEKEQKLYDKFMCYCKNAGGDLSKSIADSDAKVSSLPSEIKEAEAAKKQLDEELKQHQVDRSAAKSAIAEATSIREKEAASFAKEKAESTATIDATGKAITAISSGMSGSFLQTGDAQLLKKLMLAKDELDADRQDVMAFLSGGETGGYAPQSGEITGILKTMKENMEKSLAEAETAEAAAVTAHEALVAAKTKEIEANTKAIEVKTVRVGEKAVAIVQMKNDLTDSQEALEEDKKFLADLDTNCAKQTGEFEANRKLRQQELVALADTIKVLNDDDALELFKKTLPSPALLQVTATGKTVKARALAELTQSNGDYRLNLISMALKGKKVSFDKVIAMIDDMVALLKKEQADDNDKKEYCEAQIDQTEDKVKELELSVSDLAKAIADGKESIATLTEEIEALEDGIKALDKQVAEATEQRKEEHADNTETLTSNNAAVELIGIAKNRMNKFYNPKLYKAAPKRQLSEEERIAVNMGGTLAPTAAPGGIAGTGVTALSQVAPPPPPATWGAYTKKGEESTGVISMMDMMIADLEKEIQEVEVEEKEGQKEYEQFMADSANKRATDAKSIEDKESNKADLEAKVLKDGEEKTATTKEAMATHEYLAGVHADCDWLLSNFETRKTARAGEIDALTKGKAVLSGADFSLLQKAEVHRHM